MGMLLSRSVKLRISNKTRNITLKNPRTFFYWGQCSDFPPEMLSPGSSDTCHFSGRFPLWGVAGILVYEAESFTLAIYFSNPLNYKTFSMELGLELSPGKAHLDTLESTYARMANGTYSSAHQDIKFGRGVVSENNASVQVSDGPIKVTATMSRSTYSCLTVVVEEEEGWRKEARRENIRQKRSYQDLLWDLVNNPKTAWMA